MGAQSFVDIASKAWRNPSWTLSMGIVMKLAYFLHLAGASALLVVLGAPSVALAQFIWLDDKGVKQYSDIPPPPSIPTNRILKQPGGGFRPTPETTSSGADAANANAASQPKTLAEQNVEFNKRRKEQAEKEKKAADETRQAAAKSKNCERARNYQRTLDSGERITRNSSNGEREFLTDEQRTQELRENRQVLQDCR